MCTPQNKVQQIYCKAQYIGAGILTYPPDLKVTLIRRKNDSLAFRMRADYFGKKHLLNERKGSEFKFKHLPECSQPTPIFLDHKISSNLYQSGGSPIRKLLILVSQSIIWHLACTGAGRHRAQFSFKQMGVMLARCRLICSRVWEGLRSAGIAV